jgi:hypothetical protein
VNIQMMGLVLGTLEVPMSTQVFNMHQGNVVAGVRKNKTTLRNENYM